MQNSLSDIKFVHSWYCCPRPKESPNNNPPTTSTRQHIVHRLAPKSLTGVASAVCTAIIKLSSGITGRNVDLGKVTLAGDLDVVGCLDKVHAGECAVRNNSSSPARFGTPSDLITFSVTNSAYVSCTKYEISTSYCDSRKTTHGEPRRRNLLQN